jgi:hypothetical protein
MARERIEPTFSRSYQPPSAGRSKDEHEVEELEREIERADLSDGPPLSYEGDVPNRRTFGQIVWLTTKWILRIIAFAFKMFFWIIWLFTPTPSERSNSAPRSKGQQLFNGRFYCRTCNRERRPAGVFQFNPGPYCGCSGY